MSTEIVEMQSLEDEAISCLDLEEISREGGSEVDHGTINRWVLSYAPMIEMRLRFRFGQAPTRKL